jgi:hypothetical protein
VLIKGLSKYLSNKGAMDRQTKKLRQMGLKSQFVRTAAQACALAQDAKAEAEAKAKEAAEMAKKNAAAKTMVADLFGNDDELWLPASAPAAPAAAGAGSSQGKKGKKKEAIGQKKAAATSSMFADDDDDSGDELFG